MNDPGKAHLNRGGFTLLELILVLLMMALIAGLTTPFVMSTLDRIRLDSEVRNVASALRYARSEAIARKIRFTFNADIESGRYWLAGPAGGDALQARVLDQGIRFKQFTNEQETRTDGTFVIHFFPQGNSSGGTIHLEVAGQDADETGYVIRVSPVTGTPRIEQKT